MYCVSFDFTGYPCCGFNKFSFCLFILVHFIRCLLFRIVLVNAHDRGLVDFVNIYFFFFQKT
jgi:hypothetical protein